MNQNTTAALFNCRDLEQRAYQAACDLSGLDPGRGAKYIGISKAAWCPAVLYDRWFAEKHAKPSTWAHLRCLSGYMYEDKMHAILWRAGIAKPRPYHSDNFGQPYQTLVSADFSTPEIPVLGHTDGETTAEYGEQLIEITSTTPDDFRRFTRADDTLRMLQQMFRDKLYQVQGYLRWGTNERAVSYSRCLFVVVSRVGRYDHEPFRFCFVEVTKDDNLGDVVEQRLRRVTVAIAHHERPSCECRRCAKFGQSPVDRPVQADDYFRDRHSRALEQSSPPMPAAAVHPSSPTGLGMRGR